MDISKKLKELRAASGKTQKEIAGELGVSISTVGMYETGKRVPDIKTLGKLATLYGVKTDYILDRNNTSNSSLPGNTAVESPMKKRPKELIKLIEQEEYTLNGQIATQEDREKLAKIIEALYWDAKTKNKRK